MSNRPREEAQALKTKFFECMKDPEYRMLKNSDKAEEIGVSTMTVGRWLRDVTPECWDIWRREESKFLARKEIEVNDSLFKQAKEGDVGAIKLWYQKVLGWSEKQISENINHSPELEGKNPMELLRIAVAGLTPDQKAELLGPIEPKIVGEDEFRAAEST